MFKKIFYRHKRRFAPASVDSVSMGLAVEMLCAPSTLMQLSPKDARVVARYMHPLQVSEGTVFIREGDTRNTEFMVLVLGPGSMHGDVGLIDGLPRSASCTASTDLHCLILTRAGISNLLDDNPQVCAKLMMAIAMRIGDRLRSNTEKLKKYVMLMKAMQQEIDHLLPS